MKNKLIVGLGNPGSRYEETRHNVGFMVLQALSKKKEISWKSKLTLMCKLAQFSDESNSVILVMPTTYMNLSGQSVRKVASFYHIQASEILVIVDDFYLSFGMLRYRERGSAGGHNGLKSIEEELGGNHYPRLRIGIDKSINQRAEEYVLSPFDAEQKALLPKVMEAAVEVTEAWLREGSAGAMSCVSKVNERIEKK